jgi:hypothetical protein
MIRLIACLGILFSAISVAQARVFNIANESFAAYVRGSYGSKFENTLNSQSSGTGVTLNADHEYNFSGEFGFLYASPYMNVRFGLEVIKPSDIKDAIGKNAAEAELYSMTSEISVLIPKFALEFNLYKWSNSRVYLSGGAGYANLAARNSYVFTSAGSAAFSGMTDFYEDMRSSAMSYEGTLGYERLLTDSTTYALEGGYRSMVFDEIYHNKDVTTFQGPVVKGDKAKKMDGENRTLDLTNIFVGLTLRIWIK